LNNWFEMRGDAFKIVTHSRRPLPQRSDTIGPWLEALGFLTWMAALTNSALVYLFEPRSTTSKTLMGGHRVGTTLDAEFTPSANVNETSTGIFHDATSFGYQSLLVPSLLIALSSSHAYILARLFIRHLFIRMFWKGSPEERQATQADKEVKALYLRSLTEDVQTEVVNSQVKRDTDPHQLFWDRDDGADEIRAAIKEA